MALIQWATILLLFRFLRKLPEHGDGTEMLMCEPPSSPLLRLFNLLRGQGPGLCVQPGLDAVHYQLQSAYRSVGRKADADREANIYRAMKAKSRNITLPPPRLEPSPPTQSQ